MEWQRLADRDRLGVEIRVVEDDGEVFDPRSRHEQLHREAAVYSIGDDAGEAEPGLGGLAVPPMFVANGYINRGAYLPLAADRKQAAPADDIELDASRRDL